VVRSRDWRGLHAHDRDGRVGHDAGLSGPVGTQTPPRVRTQVASYLSDVDPLAILPLTMVSIRRAPSVLVYIDACPVS
jgi:hypothetical protein